MVACFLVDASVAASEITSALSHLMFSLHVQVAPRPTIFFPFRRIRNVSALYGLFGFLFPFSHPLRIKCRGSSYPLQPLTHTHNSNVQPSCFQVFRAHEKENPHRLHPLPHQETQGDPSYLVALYAISSLFD
jgi:hypothetical protein